MSWIRQLAEWVAGAAAFLGPTGVFLIALADSAMVPMPQGVDALLLAQALTRPDVAYLAAGLAVAGSVIGSATLYVLARRTGQAMLRKRLSPEGIEHLSRLVGRWGAGLLIPVAMVPLPLPMKPVVLAAGIFQMPLASFCAAIAFSRVIRYFGVVYLGARFGEGALDLAAANLHLALLACIAFVILFVVTSRLSTRWLNRGG